MTYYKVKTKETNNFFHQMASTDDGTQAELMYDSKIYFLFHTTFLNAL